MKPGRQALQIPHSSRAASQLIEGSGLEADRQRLAFLARIVSTDWGAKFLPWFERFEQIVAEQERKVDALARARKLAGVA